MLTHMLTHSVRLPERRQTRPLTRRVLRALALCLAMGATSPALAKSMCNHNTAADWPTQAQALVGTWTLTHYGGWAEAAGMVIPFPADTETEQVSFLIIGDEVMIDHPEAQAPIVLIPADEPRWDTSDRLTGPKAPVTPDDAAMTVAGCDQMALPRLIGTSQATINGQTMLFTVRLMILTENDLYGALQVDTVTAEGPVIARRAVSLTRN